MIRVDALGKRIDTTEREVDGETYKIWTKKVHVSKLSEKKILISEKVTDDKDEENPVKCLVTDKIDAPTVHLIRTYSMRCASRRSSGTASRTWASRTARSNEPQVPIAIGTC